MKKKNKFWAGKTKGKTLIVGGVFASAFVSVSALSYFTLPSVTALTYSSDASIASTTEVVVPKEPPVRHLPTPRPLRGIYMTQCVVGTPSFRKQLVDLADATEINAIVIDIKDYTGTIAFPTENPALKDSVSKKCGASDMKDFVRMLHEKGIYVIGRITVFQDPYYTKIYPEQAVQSKSRPGEPWKDYKGLSFIDVSSKVYWDYVVELSKEAYTKIGFDEFNYDYIRYPSDGPMSDAVYVNPKKSEAVEQFWRYLYENVKPTGAVMSADLFGMVTTNYDDLNIGQQLERALPYFDYIDPMVYPSHYPPTFMGFQNPAAHPYEVVSYSMKAAVERTIATSTPVETLDGKYIASTTPKLYTKESYSPLKMRPWLQDFDLGAVYTAEMVRKQIQATYDVGLTDWILWDAGNTYTKGALESATSTE